MALFLSPIPETVLNELEKRAQVLGNSSGGTRLDLSSGISGASEWKLSRTPWVRAASFAVLRDSMNNSFRTFWANNGGTIDEAREKWPSFGEEHIYPHPRKNHHRLKNVLYGGGLKDMMNTSLDPTTYTNILDDYATYNSGFEGNFGNKLEGYKTNRGGPGSDKNSRAGVPTPGITNISIENVGQLGSLKKIDMSVQCHDFAQLQMIESLFMAPGITCLLEWGWSVDSSGGNVQQNLVDITDNEVLSNVTKLHSTLLDKSKSLNYSYEGAIATITNYTWSAKENGSFDCRISMRSRGEAMLGTQIKSAHAPLFHSIGKISTRYNALKFNIEPKDRKETQHSRTGIAYDANGNIAQQHLESKMGTLPNQYYPSFHAAALSVGLNGKIAGQTGDLSILGAENVSMPAFPRWYYKYKMQQAAAERNRIADAAKNSVTNGNKNADVQKKLAKQIAQETIANYVGDIIAPAVAKNSAGSGVMAKSTATVGATSGDAESGINNQHKYGGDLKTNYGLSKKPASVGETYYGQMIAPSTWGSHYKRTSGPSVGGYGTWFYFIGSTKAPWTDSKRSRSLLGQSYSDVDVQGLGKGTYNDVFYGGTGAPSVQAMYREEITIGGKKYRLLTGAYLPWGTGGPWASNWSDTINSPLRTYDDNPSKGGNLIKGFYDYYRYVHTNYGSENQPSSEVYAGKMDKTLSGAKKASFVSHPMLHVVSKVFPGFYSGGKGSGQIKTYTGKHIGSSGNALPSAAGPLSTLGQALKSACKHAGDAATLGFEAGFDKDIENYITKHFGSIPGSSTVANYIGGVNPITKTNYYTNDTEISPAQSAWQEMDVMVGAGGAKNNGYGLPNYLTGGNVGRYLGAIHVQYPSIGIHGRLRSGIDMHSMAGGAWRRAQDKNSFGLYHAGSTAPAGYSAVGQDYGTKAGWLSGSGRETIRIRTLPSGINSPFIDYPMPLFGHYSRLNSDGTFRLVGDIADAKKKFMNEVREKKKNAALAKKLAFADAYSQYEEYRKITDGEIFIPFSVLEQIVNDNIAIESKSGHKLVKFDSGDHRLAGEPRETPEDCTDLGRKISVENFQKKILDYNDGGYNVDINDMTANNVPVGSVGIQPINLESRLSDYQGEEKKTLEDGSEPAAIDTSVYGYNYGFSDASNNLSTYFYGIGSGVPTEMYQTVSLPSKICNHKYLASTDPRVCILPGQTGIVTSPGDTAFKPELYGDDAANTMLADLSGYKRFTDDPDRKYGYLSHILINTEFIYDCFDQATTIKDAMQKVLDGISGACGNIWNFKFMIDGGVDSGTTRIVDANYSNLMCDLVAEFPVMRTDSMVRGYSLESKIPNAMAVQALYGNNTMNDDGSVPNSLYELGNMFVDIAHENVSVPIVSSETEESDDIFVVPKSPEKRVQSLGHTLSFHIHENLSEEHINNADRILKTILNDRNNANAGDNALLDHNIIPLKMSFEIDGLSGIHFGHAVTATHLPQRYKDTICFQVTNVKHDVSTSGWKTTIEAIMRRRPTDMGVYTIGQGGGAFNKQEGINFKKLSKDQLQFTRSPISWYHEESAAQKEIDANIGGMSININGNVSYNDVDETNEAKTNKPEGGV